MSAEHLPYVRVAAHELAARCVASNDDDAGICAAIDDCLAALAGLDLWGPDNRLLSSELWNVAGDLLARGWLQTRARTKPRGYAGDHELLAWIYHERVSDHPLGKHFDRYFQSQAAPQAVRNRMALMTDWIVQAASVNADRPLHVALVGSAAGFEIDAVLERLPNANLHVTLLDLDPAATEYAQTLLAARLPAERLIARPVNLFRLPARPPLRAPLAGAKLILCPGLFDYLDDESARQMLQALYEPLAAGGRLVVFQFAPHNPTRAYMEWFGNWYLSYRTREDLERVVITSEVRDAETYFGAEPLGIDLFVSLTKPSNYAGERPA